MKKVLFLVVATFVSLMVSAQQLQEVVYLKNGSVIRGTIIEQVPSESLKIQTADGSVFAYSMSEVAKVTKESGVTPVIAKQTKKVDNYHRIGFSYHLLSIEDYTFNGVAAGWNMGIGLMKTRPFYLEVGANLMYGFGKDGDYWDEMELSLVSLNVPVALTWQFQVGKNVKIAPYAGLNMRLNLSGKCNDADLFGDGREEWGGDRFNIGSLAGVNFTFGKFALGVGYLIDFTEIVPESKVDYPTFSLGFTF